MAGSWLPFPRRVFVVIFNLQLLVSGGPCTGQWSLQPLGAGGHGCVRYVRGAYTTIKCLLNGHHLAMSSRKKGEINLVCIKDEVFLKSASPTTPVVDFMTSEDTEKTSQPIFASIADSGKSNTTSSYPYSDKVTTTQLEVSSFSDEMKYDFETMHEKRLKPTSQEPTADPNIQGMEFLKNTKLTPELIEVTDKEEMTKSMVCCNPAMKK